MEKNVEVMRGKLLEDLHAEENIVLRTDAQTLSDGAQLGADVSTKDEGGAGGWRKKTSQDGPASREH